MLNLHVNFRVVGILVFEERVVGVFLWTK